MKKTENKKNRNEILSPYKNKCMQAPCRHRHLRRILYLCAGRDFNDPVLVATIQNETAWGLSVVMEINPLLGSNN